ALDCRPGGGLDSSDYLNRLLEKVLAFFIRNFFEGLTQLPASQIFLHDDPCLAADVVNLRYRQIAFEEQTRHIKIRMQCRVERLGIDSSHGSSLLPWNTKIFSR